MSRYIEEYFLMQAAAMPVLQKQQSKLPTSMRYERVQETLENDLALRSRIGPKNQPIETRFGEKLMFSKEVIEVTEAIHSEGKDAHKVPKNDILKMAMKVMKIFPANGEIRAIAPAAAPLQAAPATSEADSKKKNRQKLQNKSKDPAAEVADNLEPVIPTEKNQDTEKLSDDAEKPAKGARKQAPKPQPEQRPEKADKAAKQARAHKPEDIKRTEVTMASSSTKSGPPSPPAIPESELPPEKQPLRLPPEFDPNQWPHYSVQSSIYSLLLSALNLSLHFEKFPGIEERQRKLEILIKEYCDTCNQFKIGS